ncbi:MAG: glycosyltransferase family 2 protein, partial [Acidobacteriota bacterium]|nr:glycosyltransferase family 2 protein [Acidobacteriota bacterium]
ETLPACEDYDLWLRVCARYEVVLVDEPLIVKYGGHDDQLSRQFEGMDRFRIAALEKILASGELDPIDWQAARDVALEKLDIYLAGVRKRNRVEEVAELELRRRRLTEGTSPCRGPR